MDPLLAAFAQHLGLPTEVAWTVLDELLADVRDTLRAEGRATLDGIGTISRGPDGLAFEPDADLLASINQPYLGLPPIESRRAPTPEDAPPETPQDAPEAPEAPLLFSVPLESVEPEAPPEPPEHAPFEVPPVVPPAAVEDDWTDFAPLPTPSPAEPEPEPLRDLSSETEPAPEHEPAPPADEPEDVDLEALIDRARRSAEPAPLPPDPPASEGEPTFNVFGAPTGHPVEDEPAQEEPTAPLGRPVAPLEPVPTTDVPEPTPGPRPATAPPRRAAERSAPRHRSSAWWIVLPLLLALLAAALWLWPRFRGDEPAAPPVAEAPEPRPNVAATDSAALALTDSLVAAALAETDSAAMADADTTVAAAVEPAPEPETEPETADPAPAAPDPLRGDAAIDPAQGGFGWVFGSGSRAGAESDAARYRRQGFRASAVRGTTSDGRPVYRVVVGQFATRAEADAARSRLPANQPPGIWVINLGP